MADTFTAPAAVALKAEANPQRGLREVAFYSSTLGDSVCQSLAHYEAIPGTRLGAATAPPYEFSLNGLGPGDYSLMAVASYETGEQQISQPVVIIVNDASNDGRDWNGWRPNYAAEQLAETDPALQPAPTPSPTLLSCPTVKVTANYSPAVNNNKIIFRATVEGGDPINDASYHWHLSSGEIVGNDDTPEITVKVEPGLDRAIVASVDVGHLHGICPNSAATSVALDPVSWLDEKSRTRLSRLRSGIEEFRVLNTEPDAHGYIVVYGENAACVDEENLKDAKTAKRYLVEMVGLPGSRISIVNGRYREEERSVISDLELIVNRPGEQIPDWWLPASLKRGPITCSQTKSGAGDRGIVYQSPMNRKCPELDEKIHYRTHLSAEPHEINTCPDNRRDPANSETQTLLRSLITSGVYSNTPTFSYWVNGGRMLNNGKNGIWDLSEVKLHSGVYAAIVRADDGCDCRAVSVTSINVTNFCTPCLQLECTPTATSVSPGLQSFRAYAGSFALNSTATFNWTTSSGTIVKGQGTRDVTIDTSTQPIGEPFVVTVSVGGLERYCVNKVSYPATVGKRCSKNEAYGGFGAQHESSRRARRRQPAAVAGAAEDEIVRTSLPPVGEGPPIGPSSKETEWINISWTPDVKLDDAVEVKVVYNRTTEKLEVTNSAGEVSEELKLGKLLKQWFGKDYEVFGDLRLRAAGLQCDSCNQEQYQSFDREKLEWTWPLKPNGAGTQIFSLELWVKGEPRDPQSGKLPKASEKAWAKNSLKVVVKERMLTRNTVFAGGGLCAVLGFGLCVRGLKIYRVGDTYNVGQAVAVGRNVTMNNTTVNQQSPQTGENKDA